MARRKSLIADDSGATAVEYGLIVAAIAGLILVVVMMMGNKVNNLLNNVANGIP
jgi:pilus assembly protein Flp/PilA